jgi:hypothetical protein
MIIIRKPRVAFTVGVLLFILLQSRDARSQEDYCRTFLSNAFYDVTHCDDTGEYPNDVKAWLVSPKFIEFVKTAGKDFKLTIPLVSAIVTNKTPDVELRQIQDKVSSNNEILEKSNHYAHYVASQVVPKENVGNWVNCLTNNAPKSGLQMETEGDPSGNSFTLTVYFKGRMSVRSAHLKSAFISGATYQKELLNVTEIGEDRIIVPLTRINNDPIYITLVTAENSDSFQTFIPHNRPVVAEPVKKNQAGQKPPVKKPAGAKQ